MEKISVFIFLLIPILASAQEIRGTSLLDSVISKFNSHLLGGNNSSDFTHLRMHVSMRITSELLDKELKTSDTCYYSYDGKELCISALTGQAIRVGNYIPIPESVDTKSAILYHLDFIFCKNREDLFSLLELSDSLILIEERSENNKEFKWRYIDPKTLDLLKVKDGFNQEYDQRIRVTYYHEFQTINGVRIPSRLSYDGPMNMHVEYQYTWASFESFVWPE